MLCKIIYRLKRSLRWFRIVQRVVVEQLNLSKKTQQYQFIAVRLPYAVQKDEHEAQLALQFIQPSCSLSVNVQAADAIHQHTLVALQTADIALIPVIGLSLSFPILL